MGGVGEGGIVGTGGRERVWFLKVLVLEKNRSPLSLRPRVIHLFRGTHLTYGALHLM